MPIPRPIRSVRPPLPLPYGLLTAADVRNITDPHDLLGVTVEALCDVDVSTTYDECIAVTGTGSPPPPPAKTATAARVRRGATAFTVFAEFDCSPVGEAGGREMLRLAREALDRSEEWQVERVLWTGVAGNQTVAFPHLAASAQVLDADGVQLQSAASPVVSGGPFDVVEGLGLLERALGDCLAGAEGTLHVPAELLPSLDAWGLVRPDGKRLRTLHGNLVVVGSGYPGTAPDGTLPAAGRWIYGTGPVFALRDGVTATELPDSFDRVNNTVKAIAERTYVVGWGCCHVGLPISTAGVAAG